jgi:hypothetical protein
VLVVWDVQSPVVCADDWDDPEQPPVFAEVTAEADAPGVSIAAEASALTIGQQLETAERGPVTDPPLELHLQPRHVSRAGREHKILRADRRVGIQRAVLPARLVLPGRRIGVRHVELRVVRERGDTAYQPDSVWVKLTRTWSRLCHRLARL